MGLLRPHAQTGAAPPPHTHTRALPRSLQKGFRTRATKTPRMPPSRKCILDLGFVLTLFSFSHCSASYHPTLSTPKDAVCHDLFFPFFSLRARVYRMLIGACNPMLCGPIHVIRYLRWLQFATFAPVFRTHCQKEPIPQDNICNRKDRLADRHAGDLEHAVPLTCPRLTPVLAPLPRSSKMLCLNPPRTTHRSTPAPPTAPPTAPFVAKSLSATSALRGQAPLLSVRLSFVATAAHPSRRTVWLTRPSPPSPPPHPPPPVHPSTRPPVHPPPSVPRTVFMTPRSCFSAVLAPFQPTSETTAWAANVGSGCLPTTFRS